MTVAARRNRNDLSITPPPANRNDLSIMPPAFAAIERRRETSGVSAARLCALAGVSPNTYVQLKSGAPARASTLARLDQALDEARPAPAPAVVASTVTFALTTLALMSGNDPEQVTATDFSVQRAFNSKWLEAARLRRFAIYIAVCVCDVPRVAVANALQMSRQNVHQALAAVEEQREERSVDELLERVARLVRGTQQ